MVKELTEIMLMEKKTLEDLLVLLEEQYNYIMKKDVFALEDIVEKIKLSNKEIAKQEVNRRQLVGNEKMQDIINNSNDKDLSLAYRETKKIIESVRQQKDTNELLIKQQISFNAQILNIINPKREIKTYNSYGSLSK
ncbi:MULTISPECIES: flagellar export chaperone FlgN [Clostridium]|uniref:Flagellar protein FlgN n=1 Tax=Clostridium cibarium TaxID=2762247 RepID=A0ABR8PNW1_9CLOT|nr:MULTISPECIES: flagellar export chaperone FlgN [Clostridium]MBD7909863.1 flagellar protein FlgN [Clostridium cibarium]